jgi:hypothetical protein
VLTTVLAICGAVIAIGGATTVIVKLVRKLARGARKVSAFIDEVLGVPEQFGRPGRAGVLERMATHELLLTTTTTQVTRLSADVTRLSTDVGQLTTDVGEVAGLAKDMHHELHPNSGSSMRDAVDRTEKALADHLANAAVPTAATVIVNTPGGTP